MASPPPMTSQGLWVVGMHRSGTSMLSNLLQQAGWFPGTRLLPSASDNPKGFFEPTGLVEINDALLQDRGLNWHSLKLDRTPAAAWGEGSTIWPRMRGWFVDEMNGRPFWTLKDPRLCYTLPTWLSALRPVQSKHSAVLVVRHPAEVVSSLRARDGFSSAKALVLWMMYTLRAFQVTGNLACAVVTYDTLLTRTADAVHSIQEAVGAWPDTADSMKSNAMEKVVEPGLRHHDVSKGPPSHLQDSLGDLRRTSEDLYEYVTHFEGGSAPGKTIDELRAAFHEFLEQGGRQAVLEIEVERLERANERLTLDAMRQNRFARLTERLARKLHRREGK